MMPDRKIAHVLGFIDQYYFSRRFKTDHRKLTQGIRAGLPSSLSSTR